MNQHSYKANLLIEKIVGSSTLFIILTFLYPTVFSLKVNCNVYSYDQIIATLVFVSLASIVIARVAGLFAKYIVKVIFFLAEKYDYKCIATSNASNLPRAILGGVGTIIFLILIRSAIQIYFPIANYFIWLAFCSVISIGVSVLTYSIGFKFINVTLCIWIVLNCMLILYNTQGGESFRLDHTSKIPNLLFKQKPNIYLVILESYASLDLRKDIYGINSSELVTTLQDNRFDIYKCFANYAFTFASVSSIFLMDHHYYRPTRGMLDGRDYHRIIGGVDNNPVLNTLVNNGYKIDYRKFPSSFYQGSSIVSQPLLLPLMASSRVNSFLTSIQQSKQWDSLPIQFVVNMIEKTTKMSLHSLEYQKTINNVKPLDKTKPLFFLIYGGAGHTPHILSSYPKEITQLPDAGQIPLWKLNYNNNYWVTTYTNIVTQSDAALIKLVRNLSEKDPNAIIILLGDHGTSYNRNRWMGVKSDPNDNMLENGIQPADMTRDLSEVFMAIKWPIGTKKPQQYFSHVNLFRQVFAVLAEDNSILNTQVSNDSYMFKSDESYRKISDIYTTSKDGKPIGRWETYSTRVSQ